MAIVDARCTYRIARTAGVPGDQASPRLGVRYPVAGSVVREVRAAGGRADCADTRAVRARDAVVNFYRETVGELRKVVWPTWPEARNLTGIVLAVIFVMALVLGSFDWLFAQLVRRCGAGKDLQMRVNEGTAGGRHVVPADQVVDRFGMFQRLHAAEKVERQKDAPRNSLRLNLGHGDVMAAAEGGKMNIITASGYSLYSFPAPWTSTSKTITPPFCRTRSSGPRGVP